MHNPKNTHVLLLMGGWNPEKEVSLSSGKAIQASLEKQGYRVTCYNPTPNVKDLCQTIEETKPDIIFNGLHGIYCEDGRLQGIFDILGIPYTHSNALSSAIAMDKATTRELCITHDIPVAKGMVVSWEDVKDAHPMAPPYVIKPVDEGSSVGVYIFNEGDAPLGSQIDHWPYGSRILVEQYIPGKEISVAVVNHKAMGILELRPKEGFYDYKAKYTDGVTEHIMPADLPEDIEKKALQYSEKNHKLLGCAGITRSDFRYDPETGELCFMEINTQPGCTPLSILPEICAYYGMSFDEIVSWLIEDGLCRD